MVKTPCQGTFYKLLTLWLLGCIQGDLTINHGSHGSQSLGMRGRIGGGDGDVDLPPGREAAALYRGRSDSGPRSSSMD